MIKKSDHFSSENSIYIRYKIGIKTTKLEIFYPFFKIHHKTILAVSILSTLTHKSTIFASSNNFKSFSENHHSGQTTQHKLLFEFPTTSQYGSPFMFAIITFFQLIKFLNSLSDFINLISGS